MPLEAPNPLTEEDQEKYWRDGEEVGRVMHRAGGTDIPLALGGPGERRGQRRGHLPAREPEGVHVAGSRLSARDGPGHQRLVHGDLRRAPQPVRGRGDDPDGGRRRCGGRGGALGEDGLPLVLSAGHHAGAPLQPARVRAVLVHRGGARGIVVVPRVQPGSRHRRSHLGEVGQPRLRLEREYARHGGGDEPDSPC